MRVINNVIYIKTLRDISKRAMWGAKLSDVCDLTRV